MSIYYEGFEIKTFPETPTGYEKGSPAPPVEKVALHNIAKRLRN